MPEEGELEEGELEEGELEEGELEEGEIKDTDIQENTNQRTVAAAVADAPVKTSSHEGAGAMPAAQLSSYQPLQPLQYRGPSHGRRGGGLRGDRVDLDRGRGGGDAWTRAVDASEDLIQSARRRRETRAEGDALTEEERWELEQKREFESMLSAEANRTGVDDTGNSGSNSGFRRRADDRRAAFNRGGGYGRRRSRSRSRSRSPPRRRRSRSRSRSPFRRRRSRSRSRSPFRRRRSRSRSRSPRRRRSRSRSRSPKRRAASPEVAKFRRKRSPSPDRRQRRSWKDGERNRSKSPVTSSVTPVAPATTTAAPAAPSAEPPKKTNKEIMEEIKELELKIAKKKAEDARQRK